MISLLLASLFSLSLSDSAVEITMPNVGGGSGIIVGRIGTDRGYEYRVLTCSHLNSAHLYGNPEQAVAIVKTPDRRNHTGTVLGSGARWDLCGIGFTSRRKYEFRPIAAMPPKPGDLVQLVGFSTMTKHRYGKYLGDVASQWDQGCQFKSTIRATSGDSGAALFNQQGDVIGILRTDHQPVDKFGRPIPGSGYSKGANLRAIDAFLMFEVNTLCRGGVLQRIGQRVDNIGRSVFGRENENQGPQGPSCSPYGCNPNQTHTPQNPPDLWTVTPTDPQTARPGIAAPTDPVGTPSPGSSVGFASARLLLEIKQQQEEMLRRLAEIERTPGGKGERGPQGAHGRNGTNGRDGADYDSSEFDALRQKVDGITAFVARWDSVFTGEAELRLIPIPASAR